VADTSWDPVQTCEPSAGQAIVAVAISCPIVPGFSGAAARSQSSSEVIGSQGGNHYSWLQNPKPQSGEYLRLANNWPWTVELFSGQSNFYSRKLWVQSGLLTGKCRKQGAGNRWLEIQVIQSENQAAIIQLSISLVSTSLVPTIQVPTISAVLLPKQRLVSAF
jgi:hypothetical protein